MHYSSLLILVCVGYAAAKAVETDVKQPIHSFKANNKSYYIFPDQRSFLQGYLQCLESHYDLVTIESKAENDVIVAELAKFDNSASYWTGGTKGYGDDWYWFSTNEKIALFNWASGEPDNIHVLYNCIAIDLSLHSDGKWMGNLCDDHKYTICQK